MEGRSGLPSIIPDHEDAMMTESNDFRPLRVERGNPSPEELAALVSVLLARTAGGSALASAPVPTARWRRQERVYIFTAPRVWRAYERVGG
ncbi:acyl-CoA carboxylase subunit epsilon [Actinacidiphila acididurans]|nr:acyl-CoA carboxylase subunit epsilon [Actinacidiphila acididurans]